VSQDLVFQGLKLKFNPETLSPGHIGPLLRAFSTNTSSREGPYHQRILRHELEAENEKERPV
jgi:hypothetical protein